MSAMTWHNVSNLSFGPEKFFTRVPGKLSTLPGSTSSHSGVAKDPVYLVIPEKPCCGGASSANMRKENLISRSSRTLVPYMDPRSSIQNAE